jgi:Na+/proline symporter
MAIALFGFSRETEADHVFGMMSAKLLPTGCVGLMLACAMGSVMDNCAVNMLSFAGIYTNSIHNRLISPTTDERRLVKVSRAASIVFGLVSLCLAFLFTDVPAAMRFLWQTVPLMGIPWFFAILWRRANRWGAIASSVAAQVASGYGNFVLGWNGDAGLPYTIALYLVSGISAGIVVSLLTPPESDDRIDQFRLLLKTPIGQEHVLREAGFQESQGTDTFDLPLDPQTCSQASSPSTTAIRALPKRSFQLSQWLSKIDSQASRRQSVIGFVVLTLATVLMLVGVIEMANWLKR